MPELPVSGPQDPGQYIDELCDRFEEGWLSGTPFPLEEFVRSGPENLRPELFRELVKIEQEYRTRASRPITIVEARVRFAELGTWVERVIDELFGDTGVWQSVAQPPAAAAVETATGSPLESVASTVAAHDGLPPAPLGYDLICWLGGGGMGDVYLARHRASERVVAMKIVRGGPDAIKRFLVELRAQAKLDHPNIVKVLSEDYFRPDPYFTMEYVAGGSLAKWMEEHGPLPPTDAARLMATIARALHTAHENGIIHRDLKPSNLLLANAECGMWNVELKTEDGRVKPDLDSAFRIPHSALIPKVSDFGLAKRLEHDDGLTLGSGGLGTPGYMPPEQISTKNGEVGPTSDVYGLGATLYHLLTGRPPFMGSGPSDIIPQVLVDMAPRPRSLRAEIPLELEGIVVKCLEKDQRDRYPSAAALADDLDRFLAGQKPVAPPLTRTRRVRRWVSRHRGRVAAGVAAVVAVAATVIALIPPEDPWKKFHKEIAAGRPVTVVGTTSSMNYPYRWALGPTALNRSPDGTEICEFESIHDALLELVPDPGTDRYEVTADFQLLAPRRDIGQDAQGSGTDRVGLYFGYTLYRGEGSQYAHAMFAVSSNDYSPRDTALERSARLESLLFTEAPDRLHTRNPANFAFIRYSGVNTLPGKLRTATIRVTPEEVCASWDAQEFARVPAERIREKYSKMQAKVDHHCPGAGIRIGEWTPRMPLGIHCHQCLIRVQNVVLTPLSPVK